jgi:general stress protein CsbA
MGATWLAGIDVYSILAGLPDVTVLPISPDQQSCSTPRMVVVNIERRSWIIGIDVFCVCTGKCIVVTNYPTTLSPRPWDSVYILVLKISGWTASSY